MALLCYLVAAYLTVALAARTLRATPVRDRAVLLLLPLVETGQALFRGRILAPVDLAWIHEPLASMREASGIRIVSPRILYDLWTYFVPAREAIRAALRAGEWPLWNPFVFGGCPLLAVSQPAVFHPVNVLSLALPIEQAVTFAAAFSLLLAALAMYHLTRDLGVRESAALVAATAWAYGAFHLFWLGWSIALTAATVPVLLMAARRVALAATQRNTVLLASSFALIFVAGSPEVALLAGVLGAGFFLAHLSRRSGRPIVAVRQAAIATVLGIGLGAVQLLPFLEALPQTAEYHERNESNAGGMISATLSESTGLLAENLVPFVLGVDREELRPPREPVPARATSWIGAAGLAAALLGLAAGKGSTRLLLGSFLVLGVGLSTYLGGFVDVGRSIPLLNLVRPRYGALWSSLALSVLAAIGIETLMRGERRRLFRILCLVISAAVAVVVAFRWTELERLGIGRRESLTRTAAILLPLGLVAVAAGRTTRNLLPILAIGATLVERQVEMGDLYRPLPAAVSFPEFPGLDRLKSTRESFRVVGMGGPLRPNTATMWGLEDVRGYDPMSLERYVETYPAWAPGSLRQINRVERPTPFLDFLNVRFALTSQTVEPGESWRLVDESGGFRIYENLRALPRVFVPASIRVGGSTTARLEDLAQRSDFLEMAWLEPEEPMPGTEGEARIDNPACDLGVESNGVRYSIAAECSEESWIVTSIPAWTGWSARIEGARLPSAIANHAFVAFLAPMGVSQIDLSYLPDSFRIGGMISILCLVVVSALGVWSMLSSKAPGPPGATDPAIRYHQETVASRGASSPTFRTDPHPP